jgi:hypothetical protein
LQIDRWDAKIDAAGGLNLFGLAAASSWRQRAIFAATKRLPSCDSEMAAFPGAKLRATDA